MGVFGDSHTVQHSVCYALDSMYQCPVECHSPLQRELTEHKQDNILRAFKACALHERLSKSTQVTMCPPTAGTIDSRR